MAEFKIAPSLMCANLLELKKDLDLFVAESVDYLHIDIMDGHYVPNFSLGPEFCAAVSAYAPIPLDIHLMVENVDACLGMFARFPNCTVSFHPEACYHPFRTVELIKSCGARAGIALDPAAPLEAVKHLLADIDLVCCMTVNPGYAGQRLIPQSLVKMKELSNYILEKGLRLELEVDGNVSWENIPRMFASGARVFVAGSSSLFERGGSLRANIRRLKETLEEAGRGGSA